MQQNILLGLVVLMALAGRAHAVAVGALGVLLIRLLGGDRWLPVLEGHGMFWGIAILTAVVLVPVADGRVTAVQVARTVASWQGVAALVICAFTTYLAGRGLDLLSANAAYVPALVTGAMISAAFLRGVPVGPLIAGGFLWLVLQVAHRLAR